MRVYNIEVSDWHTYFIGKSSILVHNACGDPVPGEKNLFYGKGPGPGPDAELLEDECVKSSVNAYNRDGTDSAIVTFAKNQYGKFKSNEWSWNKDVWDDGTVKKYWRYKIDYYTHYGPY